MDSLVGKCRPDSGTPVAAVVGRGPATDATNYLGSRNNASAPCAPTRFASVNVPPCASAI